MELIISCLIGYLLGCSSMSYCIGKIKEVDIKNNGTKNLGASNTAMQVGLWAGIIVFVHDFLKAFIAVYLCKLIFPNAIGVGVAAGCAAVLGHIFPFYLKFNGGKGFASFIGMSIALYPLYGLIIFIASVAFALLIDYVVGSTFSFIVLLPLCSVLHGHYTTFAFFFVISAIIFIKHKDNIKHLISRDGKEKKISAVLKRKNKEVLSDSEKN